MSETGGYLARVKITVIQGLKALGYEPEKFLDWQLGRHIRDEYVRAGGLPPHKDNAPKTFAEGGDYCLCWYDPEWLLPRIKAFVVKWYQDLEQQLDLFETKPRSGVIAPLLFLPPEMLDGGNGNGEEP